MGCPTGVGAVPCLKGGYNLTVTTVAPPAGDPLSDYSANANPVQLGQSGTRYFYVDPSGVLRYNASACYRKRLGRTVNAVKRWQGGHVYSSWLTWRSSLFARLGSRRSQFFTIFIYSVTVTKRYPFAFSAVINSGNCAVVVVSSWKASTCVYTPFFSRAQSP